MGYTLSRAKWACMKRHKMYFAALLISGSAVNSGKYFVSGICKTTTMQKCQFAMKRRWRRQIFSLLLKTLISLRNKIIDVRRNQRELVTLSNKTRDSANSVLRHRSWYQNTERRARDNKWGRTVFDSSGSTWSYSLNTIQNMILVALSKQRIHFFCSECWPPTSNMCIL
jgi:hypothetical protein